MEAGFLLPAFQKAPGVSCIPFDDLASEAPEYHQPAQMPGERSETPISQWEECHSPLKAEQVGRAILQCSLPQGREEDHLFPQQHFLNPH